MPGGYTEATAARSAVADVTPNASAISS
ncbi:hypothetical protein [Actinomycetospora flava]